MREVSSRSKIQDYSRMRDVYYKNALDHVRKKEFGKASEFLWGSIAQSLKLLAAMRNIKITTHRHFIEFTRQLSKELGDTELYELLLFLRQLHSNFYDREIDPEDFEIYHKKAIKFMKKIEDIEKR